MRPDIKAEQTTAKQEDKTIRRKAKGARTLAVGAPLFWFWGAAIVGPRWWWLLSTGDWRQAN
jgi:hypothetical protein